LRSYARVVTDAVSAPPPSGSGSVIEVTRLRAS
jgi:hypothetical protein